MQKSNERQIKVCLLGDSGVGKSCIARRFVQDTFTEMDHPTVGASYIARVVNLEKASYKVQIWDTAGQEQYRSLAPMYYRGAAAAILAFDITYENSFLSLGKWIEELKDIGTDGMILVVVGNKADLSPQRKVSVPEIESFVNDHGIAYFETSAKTGENIEDAFLHICRTVPEALIRCPPAPTRNIRLDDSFDTPQQRTKKKCC
ncbi:hypothetical protein ACHWQZ_G019242 [Mnemiopsis leidyi]